jgi:hypothetical protein
MAIIGTASLFLCQRTQIHGFFRAALAVWLHIIGRRANVGGIFPCSLVGNG